MEANYLPEGQLLTSAANRDACSSLPMLERAQASGAILEGTALLCDSELNLHIDFPALPGVRGIIPREEAVYTRPGEPVKDIAILTRVGKAVCFKVQGIDTPDAEGLTTVRLSRRAAQAECAAVYIADLAPGDVVRGRVTHLESFGAFVDIGVKTDGLVHVSELSSRFIKHPMDVVSIGDNVKVRILDIDKERHKISLTMKL